MNYVSNTKFYESILRLDPHTLAMAKARISKKEHSNGTSVIHNQKFESELFKGNSTNSGSKNKSTFPFSRDIFFSGIDTVSSTNASEQKDEDEFNIENDHDVSENKVNPIIAAFCEGRGNAIGEIGLVIINLASPVLYISQFSDDILYTALVTKLQLFTPTELLIPKTMELDCKSIEKIKKMFELKILSLPRRHFNESEGLSTLLEVGLNECKINIKKFAEKYYAISAASALFKYIKAIYSLTYMPNSLPIKFEAKFAHMVLDRHTYERLEILRPLQPTRENKACLLEVLDRTVTQIGKRHIRARILEPYLETKDILFVQESITELLDKSKTHNTIEDISGILKKFYNVDKILKIACNDRIENNVINSIQVMLDKILLLKNYLKTIPELCNILKSFQSYNLYKAYSNLTDERFVKMLKIIDKVLRPETQFIKGSGQCFQRIHAVRPGLNEYLDMLRETYINLTDGISTYINQLSEQYQLPLRMTYSSTKGFHIQLLKPKKSYERIQVPPNFITINEKANAIFLTTNEMNKTNFKLKDTANEIYICCEKIIKKLKEDLIQYSELNSLLVDTVANLDIILSFAKVSQTDGFCCPEFGEETRIVDGRHIFLENSRSSKTCVPNNIIGTPEYNVFIITGPNMSGKTIYLKTIALIQIVAQLGCYVPAKKAKFRICDKIFTRLGFDDKIEENGSGFVNEMREIEYIFENITPRSLIIIDELCRTTNPKGGFKLAWKLISKLCQFEQVNANDNLPREYFLKLPMPHIYISTHFLQLTKLKEHYFNIVNLQVEAEEVIENDSLSLKFTHREGVTNIKNYGLTLAKLVGIPDEILSDAHDILNEIRINSTKNEEKNSENLIKSMEEIDILYRTFDALFPNKSFEIQQQQHDSSFSIANFMNNSTFDDSSKTTKTKKLIHNSQDIIYEFCCKMYDFNADIASLRRHTPRYTSEEFRFKVNEILEYVEKSIPPELLELLMTKDISLMLEESKDKNQSLIDSRWAANSSFGQSNFQKKPKESSSGVSNPVYCNIIEDSPFTTTHEYNFKNNESEDSKSKPKAKVIQNIQIIPPQTNPKNINYIDKMKANMKDIQMEQKWHQLRRDMPSTSTGLRHNYFNLDISKKIGFGGALGKSFEIENKTRNDLNTKFNKTFDFGHLGHITEDSDDSS